MAILRSIAVFLFLIVGTWQASAQETDEICLSFARIWQGSFEDIRNISEKPVPDSFRSAIESRGCSRWQIVDSSVIHWHMRFGTEVSMTKALEYLVDHMLPTPQIYANEPEKKDYYLNAKSANYYHMGAVAFESQKLLMVAEKYLKEAKKAAKKLAVQVDELPSSNSQIFNPISYLANDRNKALEQLSQDIHVTRELISGSDLNLAKSKNVFDYLEAPLTKEAVSLVGEMLGSLCDEDRKDQSKAFLKTCEDSDEVIERDLLSAITRATLLSTIIEPDRTDSQKLMYIADRMLLIAEANNFNDRRSILPDPFKMTRARLHIAQSDMYVRQAKARTDKLGADQYEYAGDLESSLAHLLSAESYFPRYSFPSQWRRVANRYIERANLLEAHNKTSKNTFAKPTELKLGLNYFKSGIIALDSSNI